MEFGHETAHFPQRWSKGRMHAVTVLILITVLAYGVQLIAGYYYPGAAETYFALSREGIQHGYYWQFLTYMLLHGPPVAYIPIHLLVNCVGLYFAGREVEMICGPRQMVAMYVLGGFIGGILQLLAGPAEIVLVGASAGVCAVLLAFTTMLSDIEITALFFFVIPLRMRAKWLGRFVIVSSLVFIGINFAPEIGHVAHLGGAFTGWVYARRLGYGAPFWFQRIYINRRRLRERRARMGSTQFISQEIDPILDKISKEGIHSLTRAERQILKLGQEKIEKKTGRRFG